MGRTGLMNTYCDHEPKLHFQACSYSYGSNVTGLCGDFHCLGNARHQLESECSGKRRFPPEKC